MKKTIITSLLSLGLIAGAAAETITLSENNYYYFAESDDGNAKYQNQSGTVYWRATWSRKNPNEDPKSYGLSSLLASNTSNHIYYGYSCTEENGAWYAYANTNAITLSWSNNVMTGAYSLVHFSGNVTHHEFTSINDATLNYGDLGISTTTLLDMNDGNSTSFTGTLTITGSLNLTGSTTDFTRTILSENLVTNTGNIDITGLAVKDATGATLTYTADENLIGTTGYYWLDTATADGITTYTLKAKGAAAPIPEPATATLSLLALAGFAARRRRK